MDLINADDVEETKAGEGEEGQSEIDDLKQMEFLLDVPLNVTVELGRSEIVLRELLQIGQGSVLELEKLAGEPLEVLVNERLVSKGEVVVVNEKYGIRLTDIIDPLDSSADSKPSR
jgi:flagellar motor switch protein FliN/FliY